MNGLEAFLSFAEITFPVLLLVPPLITSFRRFAVPPGDLATFFDMLIVTYISIVAAALLKAGTEGSVLSFGLLVLCAFVTTIALRYVVR